MLTCLRNCEKLCENCDSLASFFWILVCTLTLFSKIFFFFFLHLNGSAALDNNSCITRQNFRCRRSSCAESRTRVCSPVSYSFAGTSDATPEENPRGQMRRLSYPRGWQIYICVSRQSHSHPSTKGDNLMPGSRY